MFEAKDSIGIDGWQGTENGCPINTAEGKSKILDDPKDNGHS